MAYSVKKVDVWAGEIADRPGGLASTLAAMTKAGANIEFVVARRAPDKPGTGVVFMTPIKGAKQKTAAQQAGLGTSESLHSVRIEGPDKAGLGAKLTDALAAAGIPEEMPAAWCRSRDRSYERRTRVATSPRPAAKQSAAVGSGIGTSLGVPWVVKRTPIFCL